MSEFKIHHLIRELLQAFGSTASPEEFIEILQKSKNENITSSLSHIVLQTKINSLAKATSNPKLFLEKYEELKLKNVDFLGQFVHLLHRISEDNNLKSFLATTDKGSKSCKRSEAAAKMTPDDLPLVRNRLLKAVRKSTGVSQTGSDVLNKIQISTNYNTPSITCWVLKRPNMSWDFSNSQISLGTSNKTEGKVPACSQESILIEDLLNVLNGLEGTYVESKPLSDPYGVREFVVSDSVDISLAELVKQILPLGSYYSMMQRFVEEKMQFEFGQVNNALCAAIQTLLIDYSLFICQLETEFRSGTLNLHKMWFYIQQNMHSMGLVAGITATISKANAKGGKVLSLLHEQTLGTIGDFKAQELCLSLTQAAAVPYMNILETWIYKGVISDPLKEFLVEDNEVVQREDLPTEDDDYSAEYWAKRYSVRIERIPKFLERVSDIILRAGKYLNVIRQCGKTISSKPEHIVYKIEEREYVETIEKAYLFASKTLLDLLMVENDLMGRLRSVKHYFLLDQGDFILQFMNLCEKELSKNVNQVLLARLQSFLEIALRMSSANCDPYKEDMRTILLNYDLQCQMFKILSIESNLTQGYKTQKNQLTGLESFTFSYNVQWPISLILNNRAVACYQMIFRHLFYCKSIERMLCHMWRSNKMAKKFCYNSSSLYRAAFALRQRMLHCVQNLEYHMMVEVIEPNWNNFLQRIAKVNNVDEVLTCHCDFQNMCLEDCMLTSPLFLQTITQLLEICREYCVFIQKQGPEKLSTPDEVSSYEECIKRLDTKFTIVLVDLLDQINKIDRDSSNDRLFNLLYRLDYSYYNTKMEKLLGQTSKSDTSG